MKDIQQICTALEHIKNKQMQLSQQHQWLTINIKPELLDCLVEQQLLVIDETLSYLDHNNLVFVKAMTAKADEYLKEKSIKKPLS